MDETNTNIFTHAKLEYTGQLIDTLTPHIFPTILIRPIYVALMRMETLFLSLIRCFPDLELELWLHCPALCFKIEAHPF